MQRLGGPERQCFVPAFVISDGMSSVPRVADPVMSEATIPAGSLHMRYILVFFVSVVYCTLLCVLPRGAEFCVFDLSYPSEVDGEGVL